RFFDVDRGSVLVGGVDVREMTTDDLMRQVSLVFQDVYLFEGTIADNIRVGRPDATDEQVREAGRLARVDEVVARLPRGWDTQVGEGGDRLSGGERQRVSIARAILKDAPIVLLDEATSALDPVNEAAVQEALSALTADRTLLVVAHRLQTVAAADQVVVLEAGRVAEIGTHDELLVAGGRYADFWRSRARAAGWRLVREPGASLAEPVTDGRAVVPTATGADVG
ncbi:MAG: ABC transporter ATP-binding protein, partial [Dermatophilaceae bacterium]